MENKKLGIRVRPASEHKIFSKQLYGLFFENLGNVFHGGLLAEEGSGLETYHGMRKDVLDVFKRAHISLLRVPGGDLADNYHWMDGIGAPDKRPVRYNGNWRMNDPNRLGTHEFMAICDYLDAVPHFVTNVATGSPEEARAWVEYCNHPGGTELSDLRAKNGHKEPFGIKYWAVGNEPFNRGGFMRADYYADQYRDYAYFMKLMDPSIELILPGTFNIPWGWNERALENICHGHRTEHPQHLSLHAYWGGVGPSFDYTDEQYYLALSGLEDAHEQLHRIAGLCRSYSTRQNKIRLSIDEYACWYSDAVDPTLSQHCTQRDALIAARMIQYVAKMGDDVSMMCISEGINALLALTFTKGNDLCVTPAFYVYEMLAAHHGGEQLDILSLGELNAVGPRGDIPFVTSLATSLNGKIAISLVNASLQEDVEMAIDLEANVTSAQATVLEANDVRDENLPGEPEKISPKPLAVTLEDGKMKLKLPKCSVAMVQLA